MGKRLRSQLSLVSSLLIASQIAAPASSALAADSASGTSTQTTDSTGTTTTTSGTTASTDATSAGASTPTDTASTGTTGSASTTTTTTTTTTAPKAAAVSTLLPPSGLAIQNVTPDDIKLSWAAVYSATGYNVYGIIDGELRLLGTTKTNSYSFNDLKEGSYTYVVSTLGADGESGPCAPASVDIAYPEMAAPTTLTNALKNGNDIVLNWGAAQYAESYNVYQIAADGQKTLVTNTTARTYTVTNAAAGTYTYAVTSANSLYGESGLSTPTTADLAQVTMAAPASPTSSITNGNDVTLKWGSVPYTNAYNVYQVAADGTKSLVKSSTTTSLTLTNQPEGDYTYVVTASSDRFGESPASSPVAVTVAFPTMAIPANFKYSLANTNDITLSWTGVTYATGYNVYQVINGQKVLQKTVTGTSATFTNMPEDDYTYIITSKSDRFGESAETAPLTFHVTTPDMVAPANFAYNVQNGNDVVLSWNTVQGATNYRVYQVAADGSKTLKSTVTGTSVTYSNLPGGNYTYQVYSYATKFGESVEGSQVNFSVVLPTMTAPTNFVQSITSATAFSLSWDAVPYATSYKVYQIVNGQKVLKSTVTGTTVSYTNMASGTYNYEVHSVSSRYGESAEGTQLTFNMQGQTMPAPTNPLYTVANGNDITLKWTAAQYATSYKVYQVAADGTKTLKTTTTGTAVTYANQPGGDYHYVIDAVSTLLGESPTGADLTFTLTLPEMQAPAGVTSKVQNGNDVVLSWAASTYANSYKVYEIVDGQPVLKSTVTGTGATISNVAAGDHVYEVYSVSTRFGESAQGTQLSLTMAETTMAAPANLTQTLANGNDITLKWNGVTYANRYKVYQIVDGQSVLKQTVTGTSATFANLPEGDYTYVVTAESDRFGESDGSKASFTIDFPTMQAPGTLTDTIANGNDITLRWGTATYNTAYKVYQVAADGTKTLVKSQTGTSLTLVNQPEGDYTFEVHSYSDRFGESPEGSTVSFSLDFPTMQAPAALTDTIANGNDITLKWNAALYNTAYKVYQVAADGTKTLVKSQNGTSLTLVNMPEGHYTYEVHSYSDRFGESPVGSTLNFDLIWPVVQPPVLTSNVTNANNLTLSWPAVTWANEYRVYKVNADGTREQLYKGTNRTFSIYNMAQDTFSYEVTAYSTRFGESQASNRATVTIVYPEMQAPTATAAVTGPASAKLTWSFATYANGYNIYEIVNGKPVQIAQNLNALSYTLNNLSYANHQYYITSYSNSFGESQPSNTVTAQLITDTVAPVTQSNAPADWTNQAVTVTLSATDNDTGVAHTYYSTDGSNFVEGNTFTVTKGGVTTVYYYSLDKAGNKEKVQSVNVKIDQTLPGTTTNAPAGWQAGDVTLNFNVTENESGVANTYYSVNGGSYAAGNSVTLTQEGANTITYYSVDKAGNAEQPRTATVMIDKTAPVTTAEQPAGFSNQDVTVKLTASDDQSGLAKTYYSINGSDYVEGDTFTVDMEGVNSVSYYSVDQAGNKESAKTLEVKLDKTAPVTKASAPSDWTNADATVDLTATDAQSGVAKTYYSVNGSDFAEGTTVALTQEGVNKVTYYSIDAAGNKEAEQSVEVKLDKTAPVTAATAPSDWTKDDATVNLTATDAQSGVAKTYYSVNGSDFAEGTTVALTQEGVNKVTYYSVDAAGNKEAEQTVEVKLDKTAPVTAATAPSSDWTKNDVTLNLAATDAQSGVAKTYYSVNGSDFVEGTSVTLAQEGVNTVAYYSVDAAGNAEAVKTAEVKIDKTAPVVTTDLKDEYKMGTSLKLNFPVTDASAVTQKIVVNGPFINNKVVANGDTVKFFLPGNYTVTVTATDAAGNVTTYTKKIVIYIPITIDVTAKKIKDNKGEFTVRVELPIGYSTTGFDLNSVTLNGTKAMNSNNGYYNQAKLGQFKFERSDFDWNNPNQTFEFRGYVLGLLVVGQAKVNIIK